MRAEIQELQDKKAAFEQEVIRREAERNAMIAELESLRDIKRNEGLKAAMPMEKPSWEVEKDRLSEEIAQLKKEKEDKEKLAEGIRNARDAGNREHVHQETEISTGIRTSTYLRPSTTGGPVGVPPPPPSSALERYRRRQEEDHKRRIHNQFVEDIRAQSDRRGQTEGPRGQPERARGRPDSARGRPEAARGQPAATRDQLEQALAAPVSFNPVSYNADRYNAYEDIRLQGENNVNTSPTERRGDIDMRQYRF